MLCYVMLCSYDDFCSIICTVLRGRYCVIQHSCCNTNTNKQTVGTLANSPTTEAEFQLQSILLPVDVRRPLEVKLQVCDAADSDPEVVALRRGPGMMPL